MKAVALVAALAVARLCALPSAVQAQPTPAPGFTGRYAGNAAASNMAGGQVPPDFVFEIEDDGHTVRLLQTFRDPDGQPDRNEWRGPTDGRPRPAISRTPHALALSRTADGALIIRAYTSEGRPTGEEICTLHRDGSGFTCRNMPGSTLSRQPFAYVFDRLR
jgi:hypothetical protein